MDCSYPIPVLMFLLLLPRWVTIMEDFVHLFTLSRSLLILVNSRFILLEFSFSSFKIFLSLSTSSFWSGSSLPFSLPKTFNFRFSVLSSRLWDSSCLIFPWRSCLFLLRSMCSNFKLDKEASSWLLVLTSSWIVSMEASNKNESFFLENFTTLSFRSRRFTSVSSESDLG